MRLLRFLWCVVLLVAANTPQSVDSCIPRGLFAKSLTLDLVTNHGNILIPKQIRHRRGFLQAAKSSFKSDSSNNEDQQKDNDHQQKNQDDTDNNLRKTFENDLSFDRRSWFLFTLVGGSSSMFVTESLQPLAFQTSTTAAVAAEIPDEIGNDNLATRRLGKLPDSIVQSLVFEKILGAGSYKTVYLVSTTIPEANHDAGRTVRYALAVERLRTKRDVKNAFRGVKIPEMIQHGLHDDSHDEELFETIVDWWIQPSSLPDFEQGKPLFPATTQGADIDKILGRTQSEPPKNFAGSRYMLSFKPVYDTDFKRFIRNAPVLVPVGTTSGKPQPGKSSLFSYWTEPVLMSFVLEILHAGRLMHEAGIVHRDIKPKNMMIYTVPASTGGLVKRPVIIDYGFAEFGDPLMLESGSPKDVEKKKDICVVRAGQLKGEVDYVLAEDLENYRGCQRGDAYAMGKTLYEFIFGSADLQQRPQEDREAISVEGAALQNQAFYNILTSNGGRESRFPLSKGAADCLMSIIRGLCGTALNDGTPSLSFMEAEGILSNYLEQP